MSIVLAIHGLAKSFGSLRVIEQVSLELEDNTCHALIGPNGAGKSTLINLISGTLAADAGTIVLANQDLTGSPVPHRALAGLGRTFQLTSIIPTFSVLQNVTLAAQAKDGSSLRFFARVAEETRLNERARAVLDMLDLGDRQEIRAADLSHGEHRLLELAMAIVAEPKALLLDEPMAGMGRGESEALVETLVVLKQSIPMLLVEHDMDAVFKLADTISVLANGCIVASGNPDEVRADTHARAAYLGGGAE